MRRGLVLGLCALVLCQFLAACAIGVPPSPEALAANDPYEATDLTDILYHRHRETIAWLPSDPEVAGLG